MGSRRHWLLVLTDTCLCRHGATSWTSFSLGSQKAQLHLEPSVTQTALPGTYEPASLATAASWSWSPRKPLHLPKAPRETRWALPTLQKIRQQSGKKNYLLQVTKQVGSRASNKYNPDVLDSTSSLHHAASLSSMLEGNVLHLLIPPFPLSIEIKAGIWLPKPWILQWFPRPAVTSANISIESSPNGQLKVISLPSSLSVQNSFKHTLLLYRYALCIHISILWLCREPLITKI